MVFRPMPAVGPGPAQSAEFVKRRGWSWSYRHPGRGTLAVGALMSVAWFVPSAISNAHYLTDTVGALAASLAGTLTRYVIVRRRHDRWARAGLYDEMR